MRHHRALLAALLLTLPACSTRERANPFDPNNAVTSGRPVGFTATAGDARVDFTWVEQQGSGLIGYRLYRRSSVQPDLEPVGGLYGTTVTRAVDSTVVNGIDYEYWLYYVFDRGHGDNPAVDLATPGRLRPWVADAAHGSFARLTPDGRRVAFRRSGLRGPTAIDVDSLNGEVWVSDTFGGEVLVFTPSTNLTVTIGNVTTPIGLAVRPGGHSAYVCDPDLGSVFHFAASGGVASPTIQSVDNPIGVAFDRSDSSVWICERGSSFVRRHAADGQLIWRIPVDRPSRVAVDEGTGYGWVTSFDGHRIVRISRGGVVEEMSRAVAGPLGIAVDARRGRIWVADAFGNAVVGLNRDGGVEVLVGGLSGVRAVAVHEESGDVWAAVLGSAEIVRISASGGIRVRQGGFGEPYDIALDPGGHP
jgi:DNA-binding beta-propeller fold protein YncE